MLDINVIRAEKEAIQQALTKRNWNEERLQVLDQVIEKDDLRKSLQTQLDELNAQVNATSKAIGQLFAQGKQEEGNAERQKVVDLKEQIKNLDDDHKRAKSDIEDLLLTIPNRPHSSVPNGTSDEDNEVYQAWDGDLPELPENALPHWELAEKYNIFDLKLGVKITGSGFPLFRGQGARLQRALINFFLNEANAAGYEEIGAPLLVNEDTARGTGQLPDKDGQMYYVEKDDLYLIPTAEVPVTNIYRGDRLKTSDFPIKMAGYTPCFRREAGSYGADVKGLNRVHQFDKVEIVQIQHPEHSYDTLQEMLQHVEGLLNKLELPYRILRLCGGDLTFASALTFDFEVYSAAQKKWLEVSSVSNFESFQANRLGLKFKDEQGKNQWAHTLNGSALALARIIAALLENHQTPDGIRIPAALVPYMGTDMIK